MRSPVYRVLQLQFKPVTYRVHSPARSRSTPGINSIQRGVKNNTADTELNTNYVELFSLKDFYSRVGFVVVKILQRCVDIPVLNCVQSRNRSVSHFFSQVSPGVATRAADVVALLRSNGAYQKHTSTLRLSMKTCTYLL